MVMKWVKLSLVACVVGLPGAGSAVQANSGLYSGIGPLLRHLC